ncbi:MAG: Alkyl hydroperoxide reductase subunit C-like protein [Candidatus Carbobacillus altaicus]|uniref:Peroxiredoxin n=1 Tax=Candidatus Carbonibacillus altaicus TaxID=2163959 RepID=A0A2R6Y483_9BACL|nr:MAG: Alkyl hydroperoxide reductase subunit C-like protein [Candidatus Carbobacillus altaicus]
MSEQFVASNVNPMPRIGEKAPNFEAVTTHGTLRLSDYAGSWLILFSHPADFTPVCTTEFIAFQEIYPELKKLGVELLGVSVDSLYSHIAWTRNIEEKMGVRIEFPIVADLDMNVAKKFGMIMPEEHSTEAVRAVFIIDDKQIIRAIIYYPLSAGRNMSEVLRLIQALKTSDAHRVATPANWHPGDAVIVPTPTTVEEAEARMMEQDIEVIDWYLSKKKI